MLGILYKGLLPLIFSFFERGNVQLGRKQEIMETVIIRFSERNASTACGRTGVLGKGMDRMVKQRRIGITSRIVRTSGL